LASPAEFSACASRQGLDEAPALCGEDRKLWLDLLFSHLIQPRLGQGRACFVHDYPACLPSLARAKPGEADVVERVELFLDGIELGNGYHELADATEQERRFDADLAARQALGLELPPKDRLLLAALESGLPDCAGIALGLDRLLMLATGAATIGQVLAFPIERA
jgi:lysyl-tRNA synthetase class 2